MLTIIPMGTETLATKLIHIENNQINMEIIEDRTVTHMLNRTIEAGTIK